MVGQNVISPARSGTMIGRVDLCNRIRYIHDSASFILVTASGWVLIAGCLRVLNYYNHAHT